MSGIYPETRRENITRNHGQESWTEVEETPGLIRRRTVVAREWVEERTDCFCCSCGDFSADPACRNHGFAGTRPCEVHNMPGSEWDDEFPGGPRGMPESVQAVRRREWARQW